MKEKKFYFFGIETLCKNKGNKSLSLVVDTNRKGSKF